MHPQAPPSPPSQNSNWTNADVAAATVLVAMSIDSSSQGTWTAGSPAKEESSGLSGVSGSSPCAGDERSSTYKSMVNPEAEKVAKKEQCSTEGNIATPQKMLRPVVQTPVQTPALVEMPMAVSPPSPFGSLPNVWGFNAPVPSSAPLSLPMFDSGAAMWPGIFERTSSTPSNASGWCPPNGVRMSRQVSLTTARSALPELTIARNGMQIISHAEMRLRGHIIENKK